MAVDSRYVVDVDEGTFEREVIQRSHEAPVVVDFWASWCGPCRVLGPVLERLAMEGRGAFVLAKVDTDRNQGLAQAFGIQGIPAVKAFRDGRLVDEFVGAQPEPTVRSWLAGIMPTEADLDAAAAARAEASGDVAGAEDLYRRVLEGEPSHVRARLGLARRVVDGGRAAEYDEAARLLSGLLLEGADEVEAKRLLAAIELGRAATGMDEASARARLDADPLDHEARYHLAMRLSATGRHAEALDHLLKIVERDRAFRDDGARKAMVEIFNLVGIRSPLADAYRSKLAQVLYR